MIDKPMPGPSPEADIVTKLERYKPGMVAQVKRQGKANWRGGYQFGTNGKPVLNLFNTLLALRYAAIRRSKIASPSMKCLMPSS